MHGVAVKINRDVDGLRPEASDAPGAAAEGDGPATAGGGVVSVGCVEGGCVVPVGGEDGAAGEEPSFFEVVVDEVLDKKLVDCRTAAGTGEGPDVVGEGAESPVAGLQERNDRGTDADLALTEELVGGGGEDPGRADAPDELSGLGGREEEGGAHVAEAELAARGLCGVGLPDDGLDDARDKHRVGAE